MSSWRHFSAALAAVTVWVYSYLCMSIRDTKIVSSAECGPHYNTSLALNAIHAFKHVANELKLRYAVGDGSMLAMVRNGRLMPWDKDIDIEIPRSYSAQIRGFWNKLEPISQETAARVKDIIFNGEEWTWTNTQKDIHRMQTDEDFRKRTFRSFTDPNGRSWLMLNRNHNEEWFQFWSLDASTPPHPFLEFDIGNDALVTEAGGTDFEHGLVPCTIVDGLGNSAEMTCRENFDQYVKLQYKDWNVERCCYDLSQKKFRSKAGVDFLPLDASGGTEKDIDGFVCGT